VAPELACAALSRFKNVRRRLELRGEVAAVKVYDDFAHHPTAMHTTLAGLRRKVEKDRIAPGARRQQRLLAVFEPRSNTMKLGTMKAQLPWALEDADLSFCLQGPYGWSAREALAPLGSTASVADSVAALVAEIARVARPGDHVLCMSNGDFGGIHGRLLEALQARAD
jgi:UDP-N-acetylmuramate: L-alanyl-gamma-D-glutamyl-meso-diaminopimelate ligase